MVSLPHLLTTFLLFQAPPDKSAAERAAEASERAAAAAERAAEAAERTAAAAERAAEAAERTAAFQLPAKAVKEEAAVKEEKKEEKKKENPWSATAGLGLIVLTGNASTITFNGLATAEYKAEHWIYAIKAFGAFGRSRLPEVENVPTEEPQVVALNAGIQARVDRRFTEQFSGYLLTGADADHVKSVELRAFGEAGASATWWDRTTEDGRNSFLRTDLAFRFASERRFQYYPLPENLPDVFIGGPRVGVNFRYALTKDVMFLDEASVLASMLDSSRIIISNQAKLTVRISEALGLGTTFLMQYDSQPPEGKVPTDTSLTVSFEMGF